MGEILVGVDGSATSHRALRWAVDEARLRGAVLLVVHAYKPTPIRRPYPTVDPYVPAEVMQAVTDNQRALQQAQDDRDRERAESLIEQALRETGGDDGGVVVKSVALARDAGRTLVEMSAHAELLVVGSRGRGGFTGLLLGSVSQHCVHHAHCPVVVIH
jgi:nucleotide-binding universal stress UspA family protein